jgi:Uri superfamily endonuclease
MKGSYVLVAELKSNQKMKIGKLGEILFPKGYYCYVGSALGNSTSLENRLKRHKKLSESKKGKLHWHIDYFLVNPEVEIIKTVKIPGKKRLECKIAKKIKNHSRDFIRNFGCSDCKCDSHFYFFPDQSYEKIFQEDIDEDKKGLKSFSERLKQIF